MLRRCCVDGRISGASSGVPVATWSQLVLRALPGLLVFCRAFPCGASLASPCFALLRIVAPSLPCPPSIPERAVKRGYNACSARTCACADVEAYGTRGRAQHRITQYSKTWWPSKGLADPHPPASQSIDAASPFCPVWRDDDEADEEEDDKSEPTDINIGCMAKSFWAPPGCSRQNVAPPSCFDSPGPNPILRSGEGGG